MSWFGRKKKVVTETVEHADGSKEQIKMLADPSPAPAASSAAPVATAPPTPAGNEGISSLCKHFEEIVALLEAIEVIVKAEGAGIVKPTAEDIKTLLAPYQNVNEHVKQLFALYKIIGPDGEKEEKKKKKKKQEEAEESDSSSESEDDTKGKKTNSKQGENTVLFSALIAPVVV